MSSEGSEIFKDGQLSYVGHDSETIPAHLVQNYGPLTTRLDLSFNTITTLSGLEGFPKLQELVMDNNCLSDTLQVPALPHLHTLTLNKNSIQDLDSLLDQLQQRLPQLTYLSLLGNKACPNQLSWDDKDDDDYNRYRLYVLHRLPQLRFLDSTPVKDTEMKEAKNKGQFLRVVRPPEDDILADEARPTHNTSPYSPLPSNLRQEHAQPAASFGKCKYVYYGRHSEGNRFIRNTDL